MYKTCEKCGVKRDLDIAKICPVCQYGKPESVRKKLGLKIKVSDISKDFRLLITPDEFMNQFSKKQLNGRTLEIVARKKAIVRTLRDHYKLSFPIIAKLMKYRDHTTAFHHYYKDNIFMG